MSGPRSNRDKLKTRFIEASDDELRMVFASTRSSALEREVAREELHARGIGESPSSAKRDETSAAVGHAPETDREHEPFRPVAGPDDAPRPGGVPRIALVIVGVGLLLTQGFRLWSREQQTRARWDETLQAVQYDQDMQRYVDEIDPAVLEAIQRGEPITVDAQGRLVTPAAARAVAHDDAATRLDAECSIDAHHCITAGLAFERGEGVVIAPDRALTYFDRACEGGVDEGCERAAALRLAARQDTP